MISLTSRRSVPRRALGSLLAYRRQVWRCIFVCYTLTFGFRNRSSGSYTPFFEPSS